jgi:hypothetical protein
MKTRDIWSKPLHIFILVSVKYIFNLFKINFDCYFNVYRRLLTIKINLYNFVIFRQNILHVFHNEASR